MIPHKVSKIYTTADMTFMVEFVNLETNEIVTLEFDDMPDLNLGDEVDLSFQDSFLDKLKDLRLITVLKYGLILATIYLILKAVLT